MLQCFMAGKVLKNEQPKPYVLQSNPGSSTIVEEVSFCIQNACTSRTVSEFYGARWNRKWLGLDSAHQNHRQKHGAVLSTLSMNRQGNALDGVLCGYVLLKCAVPNLCM